MRGRYPGRGGGWSTVRQRPPPGSPGPPRASPDLPGANAFQPPHQQQCVIAARRKSRRQEWPQDLPLILECFQ
ncbi:hypothetical protein ABZV81_12710 [Streptomyces parvus]|uniref:hypothetical protein n=1 Tax=Streptomyces parvus TaxID=66428 RepID=UPI0033A8CDAA